jgi:hypothetical protein
VEFVEFGLDEMAALLARVESDLNGFLHRLGKHRATRYRGWF